MKAHEVLWRQRAYGQTSTLRHLSNFLYEFVGARFTLLAFIGLFNFAAIGYAYFDLVLTLGISLFLFYLISDAFNVFWTGINLEYQLTTEGVMFDWGVFKDHELFVPYQKISKVFAVRKGKNKRSALIFENTLNLKNGDYGFSKEIFFKILSFENVQELEEVIAVIEKEGGYEIAIKEVYDTASLDEKLPHSYLYLKFLQLLSLVFLYISTSIFLNFVDANILSSYSVEDKIVRQELKPLKKGYYYNHFETEKGYDFVLKGKSHFNYLEEEVGLLISPLYKKVVGFYGFKFSKHQSLRHGYLGGNVLVKLIALFFSILSGAYIFYKRSYIPFEDLSVFLIFPSLILILAFFVFN